MVVVKTERDPEPEAKTDSLGVAGKSGDRDFEDRRMMRDRDDGYAGRDEYSTRTNDRREAWDENGPRDPARRRAFREKWMTTYLPNLPKKPGWHRFWASTTNSSDTPQRRLALGYTFVQEKDLMGEGWFPEAESVKDGGKLDGAVRWREMIAMEIPEDDYQEMMQEFHYDQPRDAVADIFEPLAELNERGKSQGARVTLTEDLDAIRQQFRRNRPKHFE